MEEKDKLRSQRFVEVIEELQISNQELKDKFKIDKTLKSKIVNGIQFLLNLTNSVYIEVEI